MRLFPGLVVTHSTIKVATPKRHRHRHTQRFLKRNYPISLSDFHSSLEVRDRTIVFSDRLRDTLIHELCHAAAWAISRFKAGHGSVWKRW